MTSTTKFISFSTQKGGVGKSTFTTLVASLLHYRMGYNVAVMDCDYPQYSLHRMREQDLKTVYMLDQLTLSDDKVLRVEIFEKNGSRYQSFLITNEEIIAARPIEQFNLKF